MTSTLNPHPQPNEHDNYLGLAGRVCVVTGAGSGIGRAIALGFAALGAKVAVIDRDGAAAQVSVDQIVELGGSGSAIAIDCDVSDAASVNAAAARSAAAFGPCDVLVNNAGVLRPGTLDSLTLDAWNAMIGVNLTGYFLCAQAFGRQMIAQGRGALVHTASVAARQPAAGNGAYSVTKAGVAMLSQQLAVEWGAHGIRSNSVSPGMTLTPMTHAAYTRPGTSERRNKAIPAGRVGQPDDIAQAVLFLASDRAAYITGIDLTVDGGLTRNLLSLVPRSGEA